MQVLALLDADDRYSDDPKPGWPFPFPEDEPPHIEEEAFRADVEELRSRLAR